MTDPVICPACDAVLITREDGSTGPHKIPELPTTLCAIRYLPAARRTA